MLDSEDGESKPFSLIHFQRHFPLLRNFGSNRISELMANWRYLALSVLLVGCTYYTDKYAQFEGQQQNWPTAPGTTVDRQEAIPVYYGLPSRPYKVLGNLVASSYGNTLAGLAKSAKVKGADAIIF